MADKNNTGIVTVADIKKYLDSSLKNDDVLKQENIQQTPVVNYSKNFVLTKVDSAEKQLANRLITEDNVRQRDMMVSFSVENIPESAEQYFFSLLKNKRLEALTDSFKLTETAKEKISFTLIAVLKNDLKDDAGKKKLNELLQTLKTDKRALTQFNSRLATLFDASGQRVIIQYLKGDAAELERRRYYNAAYSNYDIYPRMYKVALKLVNPDDKWYYDMIRFKLHYFAGVAARLKVPLTQNQRPLIEKALAQQKKALAIDEQAPYIYNELGILYSYKKNDAEAEKYFKIAASRAPYWAVPRSNLADLYTGRGQLEKAILYADSAKDLQPDLQDIYLSYGLIYEKKAALLQAEEAFQKSIKINDRHFIPFERLGYVYMNNMNYERADSMFFEAGERKKGFFFFDELYNPRNVKIPKVDFVPVISCNIDSANISGKDIIGQFALGYTAYRDYDLAKAERAFKRVIALDSKNPLAFHYLGRILYDQQRWQEAETVLKLSMDNYLSEPRWTKYYDSLLGGSSMSTEFIVNPCSDSCYRFGYYDIKEDYLLMAQIYENWNHYSESEIYYRKLMAANPNNADGYLKLVNLFEKSGRYNDAENYLLEYNIRSNYSIDRELNEFYERVTTLLPENGDWYQKAGNFQYNIARAEPGGFLEDTKWIDPVTRGTVYKYPQSGKSEPKIAPPLKYRLVPYGTIIPRPYKIIPKFKPYTDGIFYLRNAVQFSQFDDLVLAGVNTKLGDLYNWQGLPDSAIYFYEAAVYLNPTDAGIRNKLIEIYALNFQFTNAITQLDSLYKKREISFDKQLLLATYYMQNGRFADAEKLLKDAEIIYPVFNKAIIELNAKLALLKGDTKQALENYTRLYAVNSSDINNLYNLARINANAGKRSEAWKWLELACKAGFNYTYVLKYDPVLKNIRKDANWKKIISNIEGITYSINGANE